MEIVLAQIEDLAEIQKMYTKIIDVMYSNNIKIWNEYYPNEVFESDIKSKSLYLLKKNNVIIGVFAMYEHLNIEDDVKWKDKKAKAFFLNRVGINVDYLKKGYGQKLIYNACKLAKEKGAQYLRLLVSEVNMPAINLYLKCKFTKIEGTHKEIIRDDFSLNEYGFEILLD